MGTKTRPSREPKSLEDAFLKKNGYEPTAPVYGPKRAAPRYYIGEILCGRPTAHPEAERYPNGALVGIRNKPARRMIRLAYRKACSTIEQKVLKAIALRTEMRNLADNGREARRYLAKTLELHVSQR